jgi:putative ABC transport system permease protein
MTSQRSSRSWSNVIDKLLSAAAWLVPSDVRRDWLREWRAEVAWRSSRSRSGRGTALAPDEAGAAIAVRCLGAFVHAAWLRWNRWRPDMIVQDLRYALRGLLRRPGFTAIAVATLAIGIGANAAIFAAVNAVLLRPLPFPEPDRLVQVFKSSAENPGEQCCVTSPPDFVDWRQESSVFSALAAVNENSYALAGEGPAEQIPCAEVTGSFFEALGIRALLGRTLEPADDAIGGPDVVVIGSGLWRRRYGADRNIVGRRILLDGVSREVVGVMPDGFAYPIGSDIWLPLRFTAAQLHVDRGRGAHYLDVVARLKPGVPLDEARAASHALGTRLAATYPRTNREYNISVHPLRDALVGDARTPLLVLLAAVGLVLLIVCVNVAGLQLTRSIGRSRELAIRAAVGAGRGGILRALFVESVVIALAGGVLGLVVASWGSSLIAALDGGAAIPLLDQTRIDAGVLLFTLATAIVAATLFGLMPAWRASAPGDVAQRIRTEGPTTTGDVSSQRWRASLIVIQTALAVMLLIGAGLLLRSFSRLLAVEPGFDIERIQTFMITLPEARYTAPPQRAAFVDDLVSSIAGRPDADGAAAVFGLPFQGFDYSISTRTLDGRTLTDEEHDRLTFEVRLVTPDYFRLMGMELVRGRGVLPTDRLGSQPIALVSEAAARMMWPDQDPIGRHFTLGTRMGQGGDQTGGTVVGLARDVHDLQPGRPPRPTVYFPYAQWPVDEVAVAVRARGEPGSLVEPIRKLLAERDPNIPMFEVRTMEQRGREVLSKPRLYMMLLGAFAVVAVFLSALGLYGMLAHLVTQRTREIAVRIALGAERRAVIAMVIGRAGWLAACGVAIGCATAAMAGRALQGMLFEVTATDAATYAIVAAGAVAIALLASWIPARRAARIQPVTALRLE